MAYHAHQKVAVNNFLFMRDTALFDFLGTFTDFSILLPFLICAYKFKDLSRTLQGRLFLILTTILFIKSVLIYVTSTLLIKNISLYNWFGLIQALCIFRIYYYAYKNQSLKIGLIILSVLTILLSFLEPIHFFDTKTIMLHRVSQTVCGVFSIVIVLVYFYELIQNLQSEDLLTTPLFWFSAGVLIYSASTIFSYIYTEITFNSANFDVRRSYWIIEFTFRIIFNATLALSIWFLKPQKS